VLVHVCPRCGYDLTGQVATWHAPESDAEGACCPCEGTCSECGLRVEWRLVMLPELASVPWFVETVHVRRLRYAGLLTCVRAAVTPWRFWRRVRLETAQSVPDRLRWALIWLLLMPLFGLVLSIMGYSALETYYFTMRQVWNGTTWVPQTNATFTLVDVLARWQIEAVMVAERPMELWNDVLRLTMRSFLFTSTIIALIGFPLMMLALPFSRAQSKVRMAHVWRAAVYGAAPVPVLLMLLAASMAIAVLTAPLGGALSRIMMMPPVYMWRWITRPEAADAWLSLAIAAWFLVWWGCAFKIGFRMKDWWAVLAGTFVPVAIAAVLGSALLRSSF